MDKEGSDLGFRFMAFGYRFRDFFHPRKDILDEVEIKLGDLVLDYGCGSGSYIIPTSELVGREGRIFALDIHPRALQRVQRITSKRQLTNVETICADCKTGLPDHSLDVVLLYDVLHKLSEPDEVLEELHRVLKPNGVMSFSDHHMKEEQIVSKVTKEGLFRLSRKNIRTFHFVKEIRTN